jgi:hypothetical protein
MENNKNQVWQNTQDVSLLVDVVTSEENTSVKKATGKVLGAMVSDLLS